MQLQSLFGFLGAAHLASGVQGPLPHDEGAAEPAGFGRAMASYFGLFADHGSGRFDADAQAFRTPNESRSLTEQLHSMLGGHSSESRALPDESRFSGNEIRISNDVRSPTELISAKVSPSWEQPPRLLEQGAIQAPHAGLFSRGNRDILASAAHGSTLAAATLTAESRGGASMGAPAAGASADTHNLKGVSGAYRVSEPASRNVPVELSVNDAGDRISSQTPANRESLRQLLLQHRGSATSAEGSQGGHALAEANGHTAAPDQANTSASTRTSARTVENLSGHQPSASEPFTRPIDSDAKPSRHGTDSRNGLPDLTLLAADKSPVDDGLLRTKEMRDLTAASDAHRDPAIVTRHGMPTQDSGRSEHQPASASTHPLNGFLPNAEQRRESAHTAASGRSPATLRTGLTHADAAGPSVLRNAIVRIDDGHNRTAHRVPPTSAALPRASTTTAETLVLPDARTWTEAASKSHHPDRTTQPSAHGTQPSTPSPEGVVASPLVEAPDETASEVLNKRASESDRPASNGNDAVDSDLILRSQDADAKSPSDPENRRERAGQISRTGSRAGDSQNRNETAEHFSSDSRSNDPGEADGSPRPTNRADFDAGAAGIDSSDTDHAVEDIATLIPEEMVLADLESASPESAADGDRSVTATTNSGLDVHRNAARRPMVGTTAWVRSVLTDGLETLDLGEVWKVLELQLEEGLGKMTVRAHRGDDKLTIAVSFTDPHLRALVAENADRLQEILQSQYDTAVELSLGGNGSNGASKQRNDAHARPHTNGGGEAHAHGAATTDDRARAARVFAAGARHEWIG